MARAVILECILFSAYTEIDRTLAADNTEEKEKVATVELLLMSASVVTSETNPRSQEGACKAIAVGSHGPRLQAYGILIRRVLGLVTSTLGPSLLDFWRNTYRATRKFRASVWSAWRRRSKGRRACRR